MAKLKASQKMLFGFATLISLTFVGLMVPFTLSLFVKDAESEGFYGEVSLRSYFECGTGRLPKTNGPEDPGDPYVITRPRHLYNLSRLQGLGVFNDKKYFQLGLVGLHNDNSLKPLCYKDDSSSEVVPFLDMKDSDLSYETITAIGTEAVPFFGEFNGNGLEIKNLNVYGDPEDIGLFGYTAHGSNIHDLFLDNVTIHARGFTSGFEGLYGTPSAAATGARITYSITGSDPDYFERTDTEKLKTKQYDASPIFDWNGSGDEPTIDQPYPILGFSNVNSRYRYKFLISGDFLSDNSAVTANTAKVDLPAVFKFFKSLKTDPSTKFPVQAVSCISLVASTTDNYGLDHSKVVMTLEFHFSLDASTSKNITMNVKLGAEHNNNIGLIVGHCDGTMKHCYVHDGKFDMNDGGASYTKMQNSSNYGLIGLVGGTVHNFAAEESDAGTGAGKDIGVLDFTTVYNDIIDPDNSFDSSQGYNQSYANGVTYGPRETTNYGEYLRYGNNRYVTEATNTVSFNCQKVITSTDLGIFTVATNQTGSGMDQNVGDAIVDGTSVIRYENTSYNNTDYYVYYATGEYDKNNNIPFSKYVDGIKQDTPEVFFPGYHFPNYDQITTQSFDQRDAYQNYIIRFKIESAHRTDENKTFYFSDVDKESPGGSFMSHYFEHKLVDANGDPILADSESSLSGVMLRNSLGGEIRALNCSFTTPDLSISGQKMYCIDKEKFGYPAANMVNFEILTNTANVTVVAGQTDVTKPAALGVYKIGKTMADRATDDNDKPYINRSFEDPDYAFFMPGSDHLAYFDYADELITEDGNGDPLDEPYYLGRIGRYNTTTQKVDPATINTEAIMPSMSGTTEYGYTSGRTRLYAHTFKLEPGRYCLGSATGAHRTGSVGQETTAKIFYLCAQGQTDGNIQFIDNTFASEDEVDNVDFTKIERYTYNDSTHVTTTNIEMGQVQTYTANDPHIENQRLYVSFLTSKRSLFDAAIAEVQFAYVYDNENSKYKFRISTNNLSAMINVVVANYGRKHSLVVSGLTNSTVSLFNLADSVADEITYPAPQS